VCLDSLGKENEQTIVITDALKVPDVRDNVNTEVSRVEPPRIEIVTICRGSYASVPYYGPAFCFHDWCYSVLIWKLKCHPPKSIIYKLVRSLTPTYKAWQNIPEADSQLDLIGSLQTLIAHANPPLFEPLLPLISRLPIEVRARIWEYIGLNTPYSAFVLVAGEISRLIRHIESREAYDLALGQGCYLTAKTIMVFGTEYIQRLSYDRDCKATSKVLGDVMGLRFIASLGGICAIKVFGVDWETDWLGKVPGRGHFWYGTVNPYPYLRCIYNVR
jgi:hypothetical protein